MPQEIDVTETTKARANKQIAKKIAAGNERNRARNTVRSVVEDHPIAAIAGGILFGALAARYLPRLGFGKFGKRAVTLAAAGAELAALYSSRAADSAGDAAREGREKLGELGGSLSESIGETAVEAKRRGVDLADVALAGAKAFGGSTARRVSELVSKVRH